METVTSDIALHKRYS